MPRHGDSPAAETDHLGSAVVRGACRVDWSGSGGARPSCRRGEWGQDQCPVLGPHGDLDAVAARGESDNERVVPEPSHLPFCGGPAIFDPVDGDDRVSQEQRCRCPDQHVAHLVPIAAPLPGPEAVEVAGGQMCGSSECTVPATHPSPPPEDGGEKHNDDDQIDAEEGEQRDQHGDHQLPVIAEDGSLGPQNQTLLGLKLVIGQHTLLL